MDVRADCVAKAKGGLGTAISEAAAIGGDVSAAGSERGAADMNEADGADTVEVVLPESN